MPKHKVKKRSPKKTKQGNRKTFILSSVKCVCIAFAVFLGSISILSLIYLKREIEPLTLQISVYSICAFSFLLCGVLSARYGTGSIGASSFLSGIFLLLLLLFLLLLISKGKLGLWFLLVIVFSLFLPLCGAILFQKIK